MTVGELKRALEGVPDNREVFVDVSLDQPPYEFKLWDVSHLSSEFKVTIWASHDPRDYE